MALSASALRPVRSRSGRSTAKAGGKGAVRLFPDIAEDARPTSIVHAAASLSDAAAPAIRVSAAPPGESCPGADLRHGTCRLKLRLLVLLRLAGFPVAVPLGHSSTPLGMHGAAPAKGQRRTPYETLKLKDPPGLAGVPARPGLVACLGTLPEHDRGDGKSIHGLSMVRTGRKSKSRNAGANGFASKGRTSPDQIELSGRDTYLRCMFTPGRHKKYLVFSASLLTHS